jgi:putative endonuclease
MRARPRAHRKFFVYILSNKSRVIYTGVTNDLERRIYEHKNHLLAGFTAKFQVDQLVYFKEHETADSAISREKQIKGWLRRKKTTLIESINPGWEDLAANLVSALDRDGRAVRDSSLRRLPLRGSSRGACP